MKQTLKVLVGITLVATIGVGIGTLASRTPATSSSPEPVTIAQQIEEKPAAEMVATAEVPLLHVPPGVASESWVVLFSHTLKFPVTEATVGNAFTVINAGTTVLHPFTLDTV